MRLEANADHLSATHDTRSARTDWQFCRISSKRAAPFPKITSNQNVLTHWRTSVQAKHNMPIAVSFVTNSMAMQLAPPPLPALHTQRRFTWHEVSQSVNRLIPVTVQQHSHHTDVCFNPIGCLRAAEFIRSLKHMKGSDFRIVRQLYTSERR